MSKEKAKAYIEDEDKQRMLWTHYIYNMDINNPQLYDMVIKIGKLSIQNACDIICAAVQTDTYSHSADSIIKINDLALSLYTKIALQQICDAEVIVKNGIVHVKTHCPKIKKSTYTNFKTQHDTQERIVDNMAKEISNIVNSIDGVKELICDIEPPPFY